MKTEYKGYGVQVSIEQNMGSGRQTFGIGTRSYGAQPKQLAGSRLEEG